jgi:type I restriction enzyme M protein
MLGVISRKAQNKIQAPAKLPPPHCGPDRQGAAFFAFRRRKGRRLRGLAARNAADVKGGAGQYFTPRPLIAQDIANDLEAALEQFATIAEDLK